MKESDLRKYHRYLGITLVLFLLVQGGSGILLSMEELFDSGDTETRELPGELQGHRTNYSGTEVENGQGGHGPDKHGLLGRIHHEEGAVWNLYRILIGSGLLVMLFTGTAIFIKIESRLKKIGKEQSR